MNLEVGCGTKGFILKRRSWSSRVTSCDRWVIYSSFDERVSVNGLCVGLISPHGSPRALQALQSFASKEDFYCVCREGMEKLKNGWKRGLGALMLSSTLPQLAPDFSCGSQLCFFFFGFYLLQVKTLLSSQLSLPCFADKMSALRLCQHKSACVYTCGTNICRWGCAGMQMQMVHGVGGRMRVYTKTAGLTSMAPL